VVLQDTEEHEIRGHDNEGEHPSQTCEQRSQKASTDSGTECEQEGNESHSAADWVEDHHAGKSLSGVLLGGVEMSFVDLGHHLGWVVTNLLAGAVIITAIFTKFLIRI